MALELKKMKEKQEKEAKIVQMKLKKEFQKNVTVKKLSKSELEDRKNFKFSVEILKLGARSFLPQFFKN